MSYAVTFHPVDVSFIRDRVVPFVRGKGTLDDVLPEMIRVQRLRERAAQWGYAVYEWHSKERERSREEEDPKTKKKPSAPLVPEWFDADLHVWGRPFFITVEKAEEVSDVIDRYCAAGADAAVDELAREQIALLNPELTKKIKPGRRSKTAEAEITRELVGPLEECRNYLALAESGRTCTDHGGRERDPRDLFAWNFPRVAIAFATALRPSWAASGHVWPTLLMGRSELPVEDYFEKPTPLFKPLLRANPLLDERLKDTIHLNGELGGYVRPGRVRSLRRFLAEERDTIAEMVGYGEEELRKIDEALFDAARRKMGFIEATDI